MSKKVCYRGHKTRGAEIIKALEYLGGRQPTGGKFEGDLTALYYYLNINNVIEASLEIPESYILTKLPKREPKSVTLKPVTNPKENDRIWHPFYGFGNVIEVRPVSIDTSTKPAQEHIPIIAEMDNDGGHYYFACFYEGLVFDVSKVTSDTETIILKFKIK